MRPTIFVALLCIRRFVFGSSSDCEKQMRKYRQGVQDNQQWSLQILDATAKLPSGVLSGNLVSLGTFSQCLKAKTDSSNGTIRGKYCFGTVTVFFELPQEDGSHVTQTKDIQWGICIPDSCIPGDEHVHSSAFLEILNTTNVTSVFDESLCQTEETFSATISPSAVVVIALICILFAFVVMSTIYEYYYKIYQGPQPGNGILASFSAIKTCKLLVSTSTNQDHILCLNGLRVVSLLWIILAHEYSIYDNGPIINLQSRDTMAKSLFVNFYILACTFSVDTFLVLGGLLVGYNYQKSVDLNKPFKLFYFYLHRILRIVPTLAVVVMVSATLLEYLGSGPYWPNLVKSFQEPCKQYWWSSLLFVQNYVNVSNMCVGQSWYLNVDMHLYIISPLILLTSKTRRKTAIALAIFLTIASTAAAFAVSWIYKLDNAIHSYDYMNQYYLLTHTRAAPWLIGLILGLQMKNLMMYKISTLQALSLWAISFAILFACSSLTDYGDEHNKYGNIFFIALSRPAWALAICWIIVACVKGHGGPINAFLSLPVFQVLSKFVYSTYLIHVTLMYVIAFQSKTAYEFNNVLIIRRLWGDGMFSVFLAFLMALAVEYPTVALEKMFLK